MIYYKRVIVMSDEWEKYGEFELYVTNYYDGLLDGYLRKDNKTYKLSCMYWGDSIYVLNGSNLLNSKYLEWKESFPQASWETVEFIEEVERHNRRIFTVQELSPFSAKLVEASRLMWVADLWLAYNVKFLPLHIAYKVLSPFRRICEWLERPARDPRYKFKLKPNLYIEKPFDHGIQPFDFVEEVYRYKNMNLVNQTKYDEMHDALGPMRITEDNG